MKKVLAFTLGTGLATVATPSLALDDYLQYMAGYVTATYTKPSNNGLTMGEIQTQFPAPLLYPFSRNLFLEPEFNWDYALGISYHIPNTCTRLFAEYDYFNDRDSRQAYGVSPIVGPFSVTTAGSKPSGTYTQATLTTDGHANTIQNSHEWRFGVRRAVPFGQYFTTQLSAFFEYDKVSQVLNEQVYLNELTQSFLEGNLNQQSVQNVTIYQEFNSQFHGWGPGLGLGFRGVPFAKCCYFGLFGSLSATLFYAKNVYNYHIDGFSSRDFLYDPESTRSMVGKYDVNIGMDYLRTYRVNGCPINTGITLGLRYMNIVNAFKMGNTFAETVALPITSQSNPQANFPIFGVPTDWGRVGPYLRFIVGGANA